MWDLIVLIPNHCLSIYFGNNLCQKYPCKFMRNWTCKVAIIKQIMKMTLSENSRMEFLSKCNQYGR